MRAGHTIWTGVLLATWAASAAAQEGAPVTADELDRLDNALLDLTRDVDVFKSNEPIIKKLRLEIVELRLTLSDYHDMLDEKFRAIAELEDENRKLRQAVRIRYGRQEETLPRVPMPNRDLIESVLGESAPLGEDAADDVPAVETPEDPAPVEVAAVAEEAAPDLEAAERYTVVSKWGRSPEVAAGLSGNVSSLIGLAVVVPRGTGQEELRALGRELRRDYDEYDNINIEVYDDEDAARRYSEEGVGSATHRMLSISKHRHSERDTILLFVNGVPTEVR